MTHTLTEIEIAQLCGGQNPTTTGETNPLPVPQLPTVAAPAIPADKHAAVAEKAKRAPRERPPSIVNIATAIAAVTNEVGIVAKAGYNRFHNYKYASMQDVLQKVTPLIAKHGLVIIQTETSRSMLDDGRAVAVEYEFTIAHTSGEMWPDRPKQTGLSKCRDSKGGFDDKSFGKAHTAARKYFLLALFQIATGEEDDADEHASGELRQREVRRVQNTLNEPPYPDKEAWKDAGKPEFDPITGELPDPGAGTKSAWSGTRGSNPADPPSRVGQDKPPPATEAPPPAGGGDDFPPDLSDELAAEDARMMEAAREGTIKMLDRWAQVPEHLRPYLTEAGKHRYRPAANAADLLVAAGKRRSPAMREP